MISSASFRFLGAASAVAAGYPMGISTAGSKFCGKLSTSRHTVGSKLHTQQVPNPYSVAAKQMCSTAMAISMSA